MTNKSLSDMVWPVPNYTDKIHTAIKAMFQTRNWLAFNRQQMREHVIAGYQWLANPTEYQVVVLDKIILTGIKKLIQLGKVKKVHSTTSTESQWISAANVAESGYTNITSNDSVAQTKAAQKAVGRRSVGGRSLWRLNSL